MPYLFESERLGFRRLTQEDYPLVCSFLQDAQVMYAWEHAFSDEECHQWLDRQIGRYEKDGFSLWAVIRKEDGAFLGVCGLTMQPFDGRMVPEIGYLFKKEHWHRGYAAEAAIACREYAFDVLQIDEVYSIIRDSNAASIAVAKRNGMTQVGSLVKHYYHMDMPHLVYSVRKDWIRGAH